MSKILDLQLLSLSLSLSLLCGCVGLRACVFACIYKCVYKCMCGYVFKCTEVLQLTSAHTTQHYPHEKYTHNMHTHINNTPQHGCTRLIPTTSTKTCTYVYLTCMCMQYMYTVHMCAHPHPFNTYMLHAYQTLTQNMHTQCVRPTSQQV